MKLFWRIYFTHEIFYSFGHDRYQDLTFDPVIDGASYPKSKWETNGTGFATMTGIAIRFWDWKN